MTESNGTQVIQTHVLSELLDYIEDYHGSGESRAMGNMVALYDECIAGLGFPYIKCNTTCLREDIGCLIPDIKSVQKSWLVTCF